MSRKDGKKGELSEGLSELTSPEAAWPRPSSGTVSRLEEMDPLSAFLDDNEEIELSPDAGQALGALLGQADDEVVGGASESKDSKQSGSRRNGRVPRSKTDGDNPVTPIETSNLQLGPQEEEDVDPLDVLAIRTPLERAPLNLDDAELPEQVEAKPLDERYWRILAGALNAQTSVAKSSIEAAELQAARARALARADEDADGWDALEEALEHLPRYLPALYQQYRIACRSGDCERLVGVIGRLAESKESAIAQPFWNELQEMRWLTAQPRTGGSDSHDEATERRSSLRFRLVQLDTIEARRSDPLVRWEASRDTAHLITDKKLKATLFADLARSLASERRLEQAEVALKVALDLEPRDRSAWAMLSRIGAALRDERATAMAYKNLSTLIVPDGPLIWLPVASAFVEEFATSLVAVDGDPEQSNDEPLICARELVERHNHAEGIQTLVRLLQLGPFRALARTMLRELASSAEGRYALQITQAFSEASIQHNHKERVAFELLEVGEMYRRFCSDPEEALRCVRSALDRCPESSAVWRKLLQLLRQVGAPDAYEDVLRQVNALADQSGSSGTVRPWVAALLVDVAQMESTVTDLAAMELARALQYAPNNPAIAWQLSWIHGANSNWPAVDEVWQGLTRNYPSPDPRRGTLLYRIAALKEQVFKDAAGALTAYEAASKSGLANLADGAALRIALDMGNNERAESDVAKRIRKQVKKKSIDADEVWTLVALADLVTLKPKTYGDLKTVINAAFEKTGHDPIKDEAVAELYRRHSDWNSLFEHWKGQFENSSHKAYRQYLFSRLIEPGNEDWGGGKDATYGLALTEQEATEIIE